MCRLCSTSWPGIFKCDILSTFQINEAFLHNLVPKVSSLFNDKKGNVPGSTICTKTSLAVFFSYQIKLNISKSKTVKKFYQRSYIMFLTDLSNTVKKFRFISTVFKSMVKNTILFTYKRRTIFGQHLLFTPLCTFLLW